MRGLAKLPTAVPIDTENLCHVVCEDCYPDGRGPSMCGARPLESGWTCSGACRLPDCVVCDDLCERPCPRCGL